MIDFINLYYLVCSTTFISVLSLDNEISFATEPPAKTLFLGYDKIKKIQHDGFFYLKVNCTGIENLAVFDMSKRKPLDWIHVEGNGRGAVGYAKRSIGQYRPICFGNSKRLCHCVILQVQRKRRRRKRRNADSAFHGTFPCPLSSPVTKGALVLAVDFNSITAAQRDSVVTTLANYMEIAKQQTSIVEASGTGSIFVANLQNPRFLANAAGDYQGTVTKATFLQCFIGCGVLALTNAKVQTLSNGASNGSLSQLLGYPISRYFIVSGIVPAQPTTPSPLTTPSSLETYKIILNNDTFRAEVPLLGRVFNSISNGNTRSLNLYLYSASGEQLPKSSWISLQNPEQIIRLYSSKAIFDNQPSSGYMFRLSAIDPSGKEHHMNLQITLAGPIASPNYLWTVVLASTTQVIVTSYKDVDILFLLQSKMATSLNVAAGNFVNAVFNVTRSGNTALSIQYTFGTRQLVGSTCDVSSIISLRSKLVGSTAENNFKQAMQPQFTVTSLTGEAYKLACSYLSSGPPVVGASFGSQSIQVGQYFSFSVPQNTFRPPANSNMRLKLELRFQNNSKVPSNYWISLSGQYLDQNINIQGLASWKLSSQQSTYSFKLVALTPVLIESYQSIAFNLQTSITNILFSITFTQNSVITTTYSAFANAFISYMSTYLSISSSSIIMIDYKITTTTTSVTWTMSNLNTAPCKLSEINAVKSKLTKADGLVKDDLRRGLGNAANFSPTLFSMKLFGVCDIPTVNFQIPTLYVPQYGSLRYTVPDNAFQDGEGSQNLMLRLLQTNGLALSSSSWIWFNETSRTITGFPYTVTVPSMFKYILRATDKDKLSVDQNVAVSVNWTIPTYLISYLIQFSYSSHLLPQSNVVTTFIQRLKMFFNQPTVQNVIVFKTAFLSNNRLRLYYQNTSLRTDKCDVVGHESITNKIKLQSSQSKPSPGFIAAMQPSITIQEVGFQLYGKCDIANRNPPNLNIGNLTAISLFSTVKYVPYCTVASYLIPEDSFEDEEDGNTRNLKLNLTDLNGKPLPISNWVSLNSTSQTLIAVADDMAYKTSTAYDTFRILVSDSDNKQTAAGIKFTPVGPPPLAYYNITMTLNILGSANLPYPLQMAPLLNTMKRLFPNGPSIHVRSYQVHNSNAQSATGILVWSPCNATQGSCNLTEINIIRDKMFAKGSKSMNANLNNIIDKRFQLTSIRESLNGPCAAEPPTLNVPIPPLNVGFCGPFLYKIPANTFIDNQDGNTTKLQLKLLQSDGSELPQNYWLQFNSMKQQITAVLTQQQSSSTYAKIHNFVLSASDSTRLTTNTTVRVNIVGAMKPYSQSFSLQARVTAVNSHISHLLATKIKSFLQDTGKNFQAIRQNTAANNIWIISWSNCSLRYDPCDVVGIKQIKDKFQTSTGSLKDSFKQALAPEFTDLFLTESKTGPCQTDRPPTIAVPFGPISITSCQTYKARIPEATFTDAEQGNTRNLNVTIKNNIYKWITFDSVKQEIQILITNKIATSLTSNSITVDLCATDLNKQEVIQDLMITILSSTKSATQKVTMKYEILSVPTPGDFISLYDAIRNKLVQYFSTTSIMSSVEYELLPINLERNKILNAEWSSCSLPRDRCDMNTLNTMSRMIVSGNNANAALKSALQQYIRISNASFMLNGICKDQVTPPVVQNPLPTLNISYCGYLVYQIPANTFFDKVDGMTRQLSLSLLNASNQIVSESWLEFDTQTQTLRILLSNAAFPLLSIPTILTYKLKAATKRGLFTTDHLRLRISQRHPNSSYSIRINFSWMRANPPKRNVILSTLLDRFSAYFGESSKGFQFIDIKQELSSSYPYFIVQIANCSARYSPCDHSLLSATEAKIYNDKGTLPAFKTAIGAEIYITYIQVLRFGPCQRQNTPPVVVNPPGVIQVQPCSDFNYTLSTKTFNDEEDHTLFLSVTKINGFPMSGANRWVSFVSTNHTLFGIVTGNVLKNQPNGGYNLTVRATDSGGLFAETFLIVQIAGQRPQNFYQFSLQLTASKIGEQFLEEREVIRMTNGYFKSKFMNILSYTKSSTSSNTINVKSSICVLPDKCDESAASVYFNKIITSQGTVPSALAQSYSYRYTLVSTSVHRDPLCQQPLNPPVPLTTKWKITASYCGGFNVKVPPALFNDPEDGDATKLSLQLYLDERKSIPSNYWVQFNKTSQIIYGWPTRDITLSYSSSTIITLVAKDKTGQEGSLKVEFSFTQRPEPKYIYKIVYKPKRTYSIHMDQIRLFSKLLTSYLKDTSLSNVGLIRQTTSQDIHYFDYANCSVTYNPCDIFALNNVKALLFNSNNLATQAFSNAMNPLFTINYGHVLALHPCTGSVNHPPTIRTRITVLNISVCGSFTFKIPSNTFYDTEDGDTTKLRLNLLDANNNQISSNSWIQLNTASQMISAFATTTLALSQPAAGYSFILTATDSTQLSASNSFNVKLFGPLQILKDCQIQILFNVDSSISNSNNNALTQLAINGISSYFKISISEIGLVNFVRVSTSQFSFAWSYCSSSYSRYASSMHSMTVDYKGLVTKVLMKLFKSDRRTIQTSFYSAFQLITVASVKTVFTGLCANIPPVVSSNITQLNYNVDNCGYKREVIQANLFYDYEDGYTFDLDLRVLDANQNVVNIDSWVNIDKSSRLLLMSLRDSQRKMTESTFLFYLRAADSKGKSASIPLYVRKLPSTSTMSPFNVTFEFTLPNSLTEEIFINESIVLSDMTSQLYALGSGQSIITRKYTGQAGLHESRSFTWVTCSYQACSSSAVLQKTRQLHIPSTGVFSSFRTAFQPRFNFQRAYFLTSCSTPVLPPSTTDTTIILNVTMCTPFRYKIPPSTFVDSVDGEVQNMMIRLLDKNKKILMSNSWIQMNTATLEIYAIYQASMLKTSSVSSSKSDISMSTSFYLEATNSQGRRSYKEIKLNVLDSPYTSDCYVTLNIRRNFGASTVTDLAVLYRLVNSISKLYNDQTYRIKVVKFQKLTTSTYSLQFSNCSFAFSTREEARRGLGESSRASITQIFSRMTYTNGSAKASFRSSLFSSGFTLLNIQTSYSCIEEPPYPTVEELRPYAFLCREFVDLLPNNIFNDSRDGTNLQLSLRYTNGLEVSPNEWVQFDRSTKAVYGIVTNNVKLNMPAYTGYKYLIFATDSSGRSANISYRIKIANAAPIQDVRFVLGFTSVFTEFSKTSDVLINVTRKLAKYLDGQNQGRDILVYSYDPVNVITWEHCTLKCEPNAMAAITQKLQRVAYKPEPSQAFINALRPEIVPHYIYINGPRCTQSTTVIIVVNYVMKTNQPLCGLVNYTIPGNVFSNSLGQTTRDFLIDVKTSSGQQLKSDSLFNFRTDLQRIEGIGVLSKLSSSITFTVTATSSRSTSTATTTNLQMNFPDYRIYTETQTRICSLKTTITTKYNPDVSDVYILQKFTEKIAKFFRSTTQQVQIISYKRYTSFPIKLTITFTNCSWFSLLQSQMTIGSYYQKIETTLRQVLTYSGSLVTGINQRFISSLEPDFKVISVTANLTTCTQPPNKPPKVTRRNTSITAAPCGEFSYQIPADLFVDEDGGTRSLNVQFLSSDGSELKTDSWIVYDNKTQRIAGLPLNVTLANQPDNGYKYMIRATDKSGLASTANLIIKINGKPYRNYNDVQLHLYYRTAIESRFEMDHILSITRKISSFRTINDPMNRFRVMSSNVKFVPFPTISIDLVNCTSCNPYARLKYYDLTKYNQTLFYNHLKPEFPLKLLLQLTTLCDDNISIADNKKGIVHNASFCATTRINFLQMLPISKVDPSSKIVVLDDNLQPLPLNSWFWFNESSNELEAFANEATWRTQPANGTAYSWGTVNISNGIRNSGFISDTLRIIGTPPSSRLQYTCTFDTTASMTNVDAYFISIVFKSLQAYLGRSDLQYVSLSRDQTISGRFTITFLLCGLPSNCLAANVKVLDNKIFESPGKLRADFKTIFPTGLQIKSVTDNCENQPPEIINRNFNLSIPICGLFRYKIPSNFAKDHEDGNADNLAIYLRMKDNTRVPRDSWIQFNETSHELYALPPESVARTSKPSGWPFLIIVQDKGGKQVQTNLTVYVSQDVTAYYALSFSFQTVNTNIMTSYLEIQVRFLTMISVYLSSSSLSQYRMISFSRTSTNGPNSESFFIQFGNCSVTKHLCSFNEKSLQQTYQNVISESQNPSSSLYQYMSKSFIITAIKNETLFTIDKPPIVFNVLSVVRLDACGMFVGDIPAATFYDEEQGTGQKLIVKFTFTNGTTPPLNYWMQLINNKLYIVPFGDIKSGTYYMKLTAIDHCSQSVSTTVTTVLSNAPRRSVYELNMSATTITSFPSVYYISQLKVALRTLFKDPKYETKLNMFVRYNNRIQMRWTNCSMKCDKNEIGTLKNTIFLTHNVIDPKLVTLLQTDLNVSNITGEPSKNCTVPPSLPPIANRSLSIQVSLCRKVNFSIPADTFYDPEDGSTRFLILSLLTEQSVALDRTSWIQFDRSSQTIYGYPRVSTDGRFQRIFKYILVANDKEGNSASTSVSVSIIGTLPQIVYQLKLSGETTLGTNLPYVAQEISLINKIGQYFNDFAINDVSYTRNQNKIQFTWSFCSMRTDRCDCYKIQEIRKKYEMTSVFDQHLKPEFVVTNKVSDQKLHVCSRTQPPELRYDRNELVVPPGQSFTYNIRYDKFYDYEDGFTYNLSLYTSDGNNNKLDSSEWIKIQNRKICGLITLSQLEQMGWLTTTTTRVYKMFARDRCGKETGDSFLVKLKTSLPVLAYKITVIFANPIGKNCTRMSTLVQKISTYIHADKSSILVYNVTSYNMTSNASSIVWGLRNLTEKNCRNDTVQVIREKFILDDGAVNPEFKKYMQPQYEVIHVSDDVSESCSNYTIIPPPTVDGKFPWWILILLLILAILFLICWLCWLCIPRCCPGCCGKLCGCCGKCCLPGGKYASLEEDDLPKSGADDEKPALGASPVDRDYTADHDIIKQKLDSDVDQTDLSEHYDDENDRNIDENDTDFKSENGNISDYMDEAGRTSRLDEDSIADFHGLHEDIIERGTVPKAESAPIGPDDLPPPTMVPPLYSSVVSDRRRSMLLTGSESSTDVYGDVLSKPILPGDPSQLTRSVENKGGFITDQRSTENSYTDEMSTFNENYVTQNDSYARNTDDMNKNVSENDLMANRRYESDSEVQLSFESTSSSESASNMQPQVSELMQKRRLPRPSIDYSNNLPSPVSSSYQDDSFDNYRTDNFQRFSESYRDTNDFQESLQTQGSLSLPEVGTETTTSQKRRVSVTRPVEITLPREAWDALQNNNKNEESLYFDEQNLYSSERRLDDKPPINEETANIRFLDEGFNQRRPFSGQNGSREEYSTFRQTNSVSRRNSSSNFNNSMRDSFNDNLPDSNAAFEAYQSQLLANRRSSREANLANSGMQRSFPLGYNSADVSANESFYRRRSVGEQNFNEGTSRYDMRPAILTDEGPYDVSYNNTSPTQNVVSNERRSSSVFIREETSNDGVRRASMTNSISNSYDNNVNRRESRSLNSRLDRPERLVSMRQPLKVTLENKDDYRLLKRGSIQLDNGQLGRLRNLSTGESDSALSGFGSSFRSDGLVERRSSGFSSNKQRNRDIRSRAKRRRRRSSAPRYEMEQRDKQRKFINAAYESDSFV